MTFLHRPLVSALVSACLLAAFAAPVSAEGGRLVRLYYGSLADVRALADAGGDVVAHGDSFVEVVLPPESELQVEEAAALQEAIRRFPRDELLVKDIDTLLDEFRDEPDLGVYHTLEEARAEMAEHVRQHPDICRIETIGQTFEGRPIEALVVGPQGSAADGLPRFLICGCHHAREWISVEVPLAVAGKLVEGHGSDSRVTALVNSRVVWIVPVVNPDGLYHSQTEYKMWRKNRRDNGNGSRGVDPNRNYGYEWGGAGASTWPSSDTYRGTGGFSEPETAAIRDLARRERFAADISFHSYSELILWPWSYTNDSLPEPRKAVFSAFGAEMAKLNDYTSQQSAELYPSSGDFDDFLYGETGSLSFTIELARTFVPSQGQVPEIVEKNTAASLWLIENGEDPFPLLKLASSDAGSDGVLRVEVEPRTDLHPGLAGAQVTAVFRGENGTSSRVPLAPVEEGSSRLSGELPAGTSGYHFEVTSGEQTMRWPPYRSIQ